MIKTTAPVQVTTDKLKKLISLAGSPERFLSVYLPMDPAEAITEGVRLRLTAMLNESAKGLVGPEQEAAFADERLPVEEYVRSIRPGGRSLAIISSREAGIWEALWLPGPVEEYVRLGRGAHVLPLMDALHEWGPVGFAMVTVDKGRLMVFASGRTDEVRRVEADIFSRDKTAGRVAPRLQQPGFAREAGGGGSSRYEGHIQTHVDNHLKAAAKELEDLYNRHGFRRIFLAGSANALPRFKTHLSRELTGRIAGDLSVDAHASDEDIRVHVLGKVREVERLEELELVDEVITRAKKDQSAILGLGPTLDAVNRRQAHLLLLAGGMRQPGRHCPQCEFLLPHEVVTCPQCQEESVAVDLWDELPRIAVQSNIRLEIVHGEGESLLWPYEGMGALLMYGQR